MSRRPSPPQKVPLSESFERSPQPKPMKYWAKATKIQESLVIDSAEKPGCKERCFGGWDGIGLIFPSSSIAAAKNSILASHAGIIFPISISKANRFRYRFTLHAAAMK